MRGGDCGAFFVKSGADRHCGEHKPLRRRGAGSVQSEIGNVKFKQTVCRADALIKQVSREDRVDDALVQPQLIHSAGKGDALHFAFGFFPRLLTEAVVDIKKIKFAAKRSFMLFFPDRAGCGKYRRARRPYCSALFSAHVNKSSFFLRRQTGF